jgi:hypothetical protein
LITSAPLSATHITPLAASTTEKIVLLLSTLAVMSHAKGLIPTPQIPLSISAATVPAT